MTAVYFNSWLEEYKTPFGAILVNDFVSFKIKVEDDYVTGVTLVVANDAGLRHTIPMENYGTNIYAFDYFFNEGKGVYFYYFELHYLDANNTQYKRYYGAITGGGAGRLVDHIDEIQTYQITCYEKAEVTPNWYREGVFYQIFPDRFYNGNETNVVNNPKPNTFIYGNQHDNPMYIKDENGDISRWDFFGGNFKGIKEKIPYLKELGITGIYFNPIFEARSNHRYDTSDYLTIDPILGTEQEFAALLQELHQHDIHVILDGVFSHVGRNSIYFNYDGAYGKTNGAYRNIHSRYYPWFTFTRYPEEYRSWWGVKDLPEINKDNSEFQQFIYGNTGVLQKWNTFGVDGWRLDVADELPDEFIAGIRQNLDQFEDKVLLGEVWEDASNKISYGKRRQYILGNHLHGVMNYPLREQALAFLTAGCLPEVIARHFTTLQENYPRDIFYNSFNNIGTHDTERILTQLNGDTRKLALAFGLLHLFPGVPCIYYGDEAGLTGGKDPENRKFFPWDEIDQNCYEACHKWITLRKDNPVIAKGEFLLLYTQRVLGVLRYDAEDFVLVFFNPSNGIQVITIEEIQTLRPLPITKEQLKAIIGRSNTIQESGTLTFSGKLFD
ncbi:glycoside hydrolase family 13 protein [Enterococcus dispar]|uniref:Glycosyl hydrolase family 13 catalytic domain-containing protein n=1 Tax=Enterococcus dispar ATCC 51266 TaxID=1139219 RepID=S0KEK2_9ENTE|nr:glycoside hydrolase family 13 protein [Enterococcus dispar]EOT43157.1 hypothetical protein OMK_00510 [Enterococcus dispar ATCC 51266]EOW85395.1 hypothetical protein I569_00690 [Enterococcus dispar ATCC 51266]OJG40284.1 hypothetical protein RV01_GL000358 [Enterococcus dispar]WCG33086.1 glycoside hydrolase family 13 protein [Enterococcus dispar]